MEPQPLFICFSEAPMLGLGHFVDDYLLDFDIYHVSHVTELVMYIDAKYLSRELGRCVGSLTEVIIPVPGGSGAVDLETWFYVQHSVDTFISYFPTFTNTGSTSSSASIGITSGAVSPSIEKVGEKSRPQSTLSSFTV